MVKIKDLGGGNYQTFPITDDMIDVEDIEQWRRSHAPQAILNIAEITELKNNLATTDYIIIKIAEAGTDAEKQELRARYAETIRLRGEWRERINELENIQ